MIAAEGRFVSQQVGGRDTAQLNEFLGAPAPDHAEWSVDVASSQLTAAGFDVDDAVEESGDCVFTDIGAVVMYLRIVPWQIPGFSVGAYREPLVALHDRIERDGPLVVANHRFLVRATKPE